MCIGIDTEPLRIDVATQQRDSWVSR